LCQKDGLVPTGNIADDAHAYLEAKDSKQLTAGLAEILNDPNFQPAPTQAHPLVGELVPGFILNDSADTERSLSACAAKHFAGRQPCP